MSSKQKRSSFLVQGGILAIASVGVRIIGIVYRIPLQNMLTDKGMGYYSTAYEIYALLLILSSYTLPSAVSKLVSTKMALKEYANVLRIFLMALLFALVTGSISAVVAYFGSDFLANLLGYPEAALALRALTPTLIFVALMGVLRGFFQGLGSTIPTAISQVIEKIVQVALSLILCKIFIDSFDAMVNVGISNELEYGAYGATMGNAYGALAALLFLAFIFFAYYSADKRLRFSNRKNVDTYGQIFKILILTVLPIIVTTTINNLSSIIDNYLVGNILRVKGIDKDTRATIWGIISGKYKVLIHLPISVASALAVSTMPSMSTAIALNDYKTAKDKINLAIKFTSIFSIPCVVGLFVLARPVLQLLFYDGVNDNQLATELIMIGAITVLLYSLSTITSSILQGMGKLRLPAIHCAIGLVLHTITGAILLFANVGAHAIIIADIVLAGSILFLNIIAIKKIKGGHQFEIKNTFVKTSISAITMGIATFLIRLLIEHFTASRILLVIVPMLVAVLVYMIMILATGAISKEEMLDMPKGRTIVRILNKLHIYR